MALALQTAWPLFAHTKELLQPLVPHSLLPCNEMTCVSRFPSDQMMIAVIPDRLCIIQHDHLAICQSQYKALPRALTFCLDWCDISNGIAILLN